MATASTQSRKEQDSNRLVGWLVSYALDKDGKAYELRAGRSLLSSEQNRSANVIMVDETSVSAPHAALSASVRHRLMLQDIFSGSGTYLTRSNSDKEIAVNGPIEVEHGDWIRVGDSTRFQVCLIDGPRR
ncbi:MAG: FHA domain-containing protein [Oligoflexia bacterium]|nr:FHA domain-containing protein [Oligoflexia bacterium]